MAIRRTAEKFLQAIPREKADIIPPTWNNNARWHLGHLILVQQMLTYGLLREPLKVPAEYKTWFAKGTSPREWGSDPVPAYEDLLKDFLRASERLFADLHGRENEAFVESYTTTPGAVLKTVGEALNFSGMHDGIHLGMLLALRRALA